MTEAENAVDVAAMAVILDVSRGTVYRKAKLGDIPGFKIGRNWRFYPSVVKEAQTKPVDPWAYSSASRAARRRAA